MSTGTGWPFGGPWVTPDFAARSVVTKTFALKGGERLAEKVTATDQALVRLAGPRLVTMAELKDPVTANANLQNLALDQVRFARPLPLSALVAQTEAGEKVTLTGKVGADGRLAWRAPAGNWTLYAVFLGWHGKQVERVGPGGEGDVIDHFSANALGKYLAKFDAAYVGHKAGRLRAYFNDSYEVDDARGESNWTARFFEEFQRRRGYDLRDELPAFVGNDTAEKNTRVMADHRETVSDLLLDEFTKPWAAWAKQHGSIIRNQAHGSPANIIDLYAASDIPETEGTSVVGMKLASSAAHVTGKQLTSAETATWLDEHWVSTLGDIKRRVDLMFLGGVNHNCYHGTVFSPPGEPWPGHHFYASVELDPSNSIWADFDVLNAYVARCQSFLQAGKPANDILLYYPIHDVWAQRGERGMPHFGSNPARGQTPALAQVLLDRGYTFDFVSDRLLADVTFTDGALRAGGAHYRVVVVPETQLMPVATIVKLLALAEAGATVIFQGGVPDDVPGFGKRVERRAEIRRVTEAIRRAPRDAEGSAQLDSKHGKILVGADVERLLARAKVQRETLVDLGFKFVRRAHENGHVYFLINAGTEAFEGPVPLATEARQAALFNPMTGRRGLAPLENKAVRIALAPGESCLVKTFIETIAENQIYAPSRRTRGAPLVLNGTWSVTFAGGGPTLPGAAEMNELRSWTELPGDAVKAFAGTAVYRLEFERPAAMGDGEVVLDLGKVADSARVRLNGREAGAVIAAPWQVELSGKIILKPGRNVLEVSVTNLATNRVADLDRRDPSWKKFYNTNYPARIGSNRGADGNFTAAKWPLRPSGLLGPVTLTPISVERP